MMPSRAAVTVSTVSDDEESSSSSTSYTEEESAVMVEEEQGSEEDDSTSEDPFEDEVVVNIQPSQKHPSAVPTLATYNTSPSMTPTVMAVSGSEGTFGGGVTNDPYDPLQQHKNLGGSGYENTDFLPTGTGNTDKKDIVFDPLLDSNENNGSAGEDPSDTFDDELPQDAPERGLGRRSGSTPAFGMMATAATSAFGAAAASMKSNRKEKDFHKDDEEGSFADEVNFDDDNEEREDLFDDEIVTTESSTKDSKKKNKRKKKDKKKKKKKSKKDPKVTVITYDEDDEEETSHLRGSDDDTEDVDRFEDEDDDDGSYVQKNATSTSKPPTGHDHDLEAAVGAATSLAVTFSSSSNNHLDDRFVLDDDDLDDYRVSDENNGYAEPDGVFVSKPRNARDDYHMSSTRTLRESFRTALSAISPLHARSSATPNQEAWQDKDGFHDELVVFDNNELGDPSITRGEESMSVDEEESLFVKALNSSRDTNYRRSLLLGRQSRVCWCVAILIFVVFLAMLIPLAMLSQDKRQYNQAQAQAQSGQPPQFSTGNESPPPTTLLETTAPTETPSCVDAIFLNQNQTCYNTSTPIMFSFVHCKPDKLDWIALYPENSVYYGRLWRDYINWIWACGNLPCTDAQVSENLPLQGTFLAPAMEPGNYQFFIVLDSRWPYRYLTSSETFTVAQSCDNDVTNT